MMYQKQTINKGIDWMLIMLVCGARAHWLALHFCNHL